MEKMDRRPLIIDGDPGHDDVMAIMLAYASGRFDLKGITCVNGNCPLPKAVDNILKTLDYLELDIPVYAGAATPMRGYNKPAVMCHGASGLAGPILPPATSKVRDMRAIEFIAKTLRESDEKVLLAPLGPLTNIADFMIAYPELIGKIERISLMGGGALHGNVTPAAEFNIWHDPEAARIVFSSGVPITMCGLDVTEHAFVDPSDIQRFRDLGTRAGRFAAELMDYYCLAFQRMGMMENALHDPVAIYALLYPEKVETHKYYVEVDIFGEYTRGCTVTDMVDSVPGKQPNVDVAFDLDRNDFIDKLCDALVKLG